MQVISSSNFAYKFRGDDNRQGLLAASFHCCCCLSDLENLRDLLRERSTTRGPQGAALYVWKLEVEKLTRKANGWKDEFDVVYKEFAIANKKNDCS